MRNKGALIIAVDSGAIMSENVYYIKYKGYPFKYLKSTHPSKTDSMFGFYNREFNENALYNTMAEFLRAFSFLNDITIKLSSGFNIIGASEKNITKIEPRYTEHKSIPAYFRMQWFYPVSQVDSQEKSDLLRLYTDADSSNNLFFKFLFFWHTLVYPSTKDTNAIEYINNFLSENKSISFQLNEIKRSKAFGSFDTSNIGLHFHNQIRHAIAHIVRNSAKINLSIDNLSQRRHIGNAVSVLKKIAHYKLYNEFDLGKEADESIIDSFHP
jgi:hypothetical protein